MASLETVSSTGEISPRFDKLLKDVSSVLSQDELKHVVSSIKNNFKGKAVCYSKNIQEFEGHNQEKIQAFKEIRLREVKTKDELTGRDRDLEKVMTKLTTGSSSVVNLYGTSGVGKTTLAIETLSKWPGRKFKADLRGINEMEDVHFHVLNALTESERTVVTYEANPVIGQIRQLKRDSHSDILLLLDNVDQFVDGDGEKAKFFTFLQRLPWSKD
ncbi:hypothetical protein OS493_038285 [Desmophyllum pertusum]|uniref:NB-ARC domain-containing protein n=1 Tax=Desmophyllum pertusum TaxID=174260 RepID=A0A9W9ZVP4_9CNID|nr:hypothetical protein OS493_038285 [Desmophyllum pertusum]